MNQPVVEKINCKGCTGTLNGYAGILNGCDCALLSTSGFAPSR